MQITTLKKEAVNLISQMSEKKVETVVQFIRFVYQQPDIADERKKRDERDIQLLNRNASVMNEQAEENLDFQADICGDELVSIKKSDLTNFIGHLSEQKLEELKEAIRIALAVE